MLSPFDRRVNEARYRHQMAGHYESYFLRANHPDRAQAFWIRYTLFSPKDRPEDAIGELWAVFFDQEASRHVVVKQEFPFNTCTFRTDGFAVRMGDATLESGGLHGAVGSGSESIAWDLTFSGDAPPLLLLPEKLYTTRFPAAKSLVALPLALFRGELVVNEETIRIDGWRGSQNHNWGSRHTDLYAWGQVAGFDNDPDAFLEVATARLCLGPVWLPPLTPLVLRYRHAEFALNGLLQSLKAHGSFDYFTWRFKSETDLVAIEGVITAPRQAFVGLKYYNPPGGMKACLNSKIAACILQYQDKTTRRVETLETKSRAAFEILTDKLAGHGVELLV